MSTPGPSCPTETPEQIAEEQRRLREREAEARIQRKLKEKRAKMLDA